MPLILTIDTSTEACSVALSHGESVLEKYVVMPRMHARKLLSMVTGILGDAQLSLKQLDAIAFTCGPGSFTGLRIAAGSVQGLAYGADLPVIPVSTLATLAQGGFRETGCNFVMPIMDARMGELYWAHFEVNNGVAILSGSEQLTSPANLFVPPCRDEEVNLGIGPGWQLTELIPEKIRLQMTNVLPDFYPRAKDALILATEQFNQGRYVSPEQATPVYMRGTSAWKKQRNR